ncbi:MAG: phosphate acyltransferase PlsX [Fidelibacterota bacterium]
MKIVLDAMGGDLAPEAPVQGALEVLKEFDSNLKIILVGDEAKITPLVGNSIPDGIQIYPTTEIVTMDDRSSKVLKTKPDSSLVRGIELVKDGTGDAFISAGHTGAIMATTVFLLGRINHVKRPALGAYIPSQQGGKILCDVGANPNAKPRHLLQFAIMAGLYLEHIEGIKNPKIGLVNIGVEPNKGTDLYIEAHQLLSKELPNFIGNIEGRNIFSSEANVIVCDGFVGNTLLKFAEGWISTFGSLIKEKINEKLAYRLGAVLLKPALDNIRYQYDYEEQGGTPLLGVNGISIVAHGSSGPKAFKNSIFLAQKCVHKKLISDISNGIGEHLGGIS